MLLFFFSGCGKEPGEEPAALTTPRPAATPAARDGVTVRVDVRNGETDEPLPSVRIALLLQQGKGKRDVSVQETWTDNSGRAEFTFDRPVRAAVRSEFCLEPTEIDLAGDGDEAREIALSVQPSFRLSGHVKDPSGKPIQGATVYIYRRPPARGTARNPPPLPAGPGGIREFERRISPDPGLAGRTVSKAGGAFEIEVNSPQAFEVGAFCEGYIFSEWRYTSFDPVRGEHGSLDVILRPTASLEVEFLNTRGGAVAGYRIQVMESSVSVRRRMYTERISTAFAAAAVTDGAGRARLVVPAGIPLEARAALFFPAAGPAEGERDFLREQPLDGVTLSAGEERSLIVTPFRKVRVACRVTDRQDRPVPRTELLFPTMNALTDENGTASLLVPYNLSLAVRYRAVKPGFAPVEGVLPQLVDSKAREIDLPIVLGETPPLMVAASTPPVSGIWILGDDAGRHSGEIEQGEALLPEEFLSPSFRRDGSRWQFVRPRSETCTLLVQTGTFRFDTVQADLTGDDVVECRPEPPQKGALLEGRVVLLPGCRPQSVQVVCMRNDLPAVRRFDPFGKRGGSMGWEIVDAGQDGAFRVEGLVPGRYAFAAVMMEWGKRSEAYAELTVPQGEGSLSLEIPFRGKRSGFDLLITTGDGTPVPNREVALLDPVDTPVMISMAMASHLITDERGIAEVRDLVPGRYGFIVSAAEQGGIPVPGRVLLKEDGIVTVAVKLD